MRSWLVPCLGFLALTAFLGVGCTSGKTTVVTAGAAEQGISVIGNGKAYGVPDVANLTLGIQLQAQTVAAARDSAAAVQQAVIDALKKDGVDQKDIHTVQFTLSPQYVFRNGGQTLQGYQITNTVSVTVRKIDTAGQIIDDAVAAGGNSVVVTGISFAIDDPTTLQRQARDLALKDARARAEQIADTAGVKLGSPIAITETQGQVPVSFAVPAAADVTQAQTPIEPGQLDVQVAVSVLYRIED